VKRTTLRAAGLVALVAVAFVAVAVVPSTTAAYTDTARAETSPLTTPIFTQPARMIPTDTYLANTATALQDDGTLWVWGYRGNGLAGNGAATVASNARPTAVVLPNTGHSGPDNRYIVKVARDPAFNDRLANEDRALRALAEPRPCLRARVARAPLPPHASRRSAADRRRARG